MAMISSNEAANIIGINPVTLRRWRREGRGPIYYKIGTFIRYKSEDVEEWIKERKVDHDAYSEDN